MKLKETTLEDYIKSYKENKFRKGTSVIIIPRKRWTKRDIYYMENIIGLNFPEYGEERYKIHTFDKKDGTVRLSNGYWYLPTMLKRPV